MYSEFRYHTTHLDRHTRAVEAMREQSAFAQHTLEPCSELDLGDRESVSQVQGSIHIGIWEVSEPLGVLFAGLGGSQALHLLRRRRINFEDAFLLPSFLVLRLQGLQEVTLSSLRTSYLIIRLARNARV